MKQIDVLGTKYTIMVKKYGEDEAFERRSIGGYCDGYVKNIVVCDMSTFKGWEHEPTGTAENAQKLALRHEIVHAFLTESGLSDNSAEYCYGWANNEEMIDWFAHQGAKIYAAWEAADAL